ncbi:OLC1v1004682C1 [Oldenlandia corymbosa var. corymbosa]|uniref:OLC1v1004682C1 n=1 Tax=Oldenlandia corymbosa var. corymbosa TaxID=529605 RepID=A0AAV1DDK4_OLDCO|nr:OLC1v1004682C1 [Oldenlandia corymbosa var. corymbosa]
MVLVELGSSLSRALQKMNNSTIVDEKVLADCLNDITRPLLQSDVQFKLISEMQSNIKKIVNPEELAAGHNKRKIIRKPFLTSSARCWIRENPHSPRRKSDPVKIAAEGVERFKKENCDLIIVNTSGRHRQEASLFEEMRQVCEATKSNLVIFVMDSSIGHAAFDQARAFKESVAIGSMIVTKMDGHARGGGALSAIAATKSPVIFIGTGEHMDEFQVFDVKPFVSRLLGKGDLSGFMEKKSSKLFQWIKIQLSCFNSFRKEVSDVMELLEDYKHVAKACTNMKKGLKIPKKGGINPRNLNPQNLSQALPPQALQQTGSIGAYKT